MARIKTVRCPEATVVAVVGTITTKTHFIFPDDFVEKYLFSSVMELMSQNSAKFYTYRTIVW
jgi:hypothetical protein